jgi:hypothetical protein
MRKVGLLFTELANLSRRRMSSARKISIFVIQTQTFPFHLDFLRKTAYLF